MEYESPYYCLCFESLVALECTYNHSRGRILLGDNEDLVVLQSFPNNFQLVHYIKSIRENDHIIIHPSETCECASANDSEVLFLKLCEGASISPCVCIDLECTVCDVFHSSINWWH